MEGKLHNLRNISVLEPAKDKIKKMETAEEVWEYLFFNYGVAEDLLAAKRAEIVKLPSCSGSLSKQRDWMLDVLLRLNKIERLCEKHGLMEMLYFHRIPEIIFEKLPEKTEHTRTRILREHQRLGRKVAGKELWKAGKLVLEELVQDCTVNIRESIDHSFGVEKKSEKTEKSEKNEKANKPGSKPKQVGAVVVAAMQQQPANPPAQSQAQQKWGGGGGGGGGGHQQQYHQGGGGGGGFQHQGQDGGYYQNNPNPPKQNLKCENCGGAHPRSFYCKMFIDADFATRRILVDNMEACWRCLSNKIRCYGNRERFFDRHESLCNGVFACKEGTCANLPVWKQLHITICPFHVKENKAREKRSEERRVGKECRSRWSPYH